jgi:hypothetical protein
MILTSRARAQDAFEIQVYDPGIDPVGHGGIELHLNYVAAGLSHSVEPPAWPSDRLFHTTLEPSYGVTKNFEIGGYLQGAAGPGEPWTWAGVKLRAKIRFPVNDVLTFALNFEISYVPAEFEPNRFGSEVRPIMEWHFAPKWWLDFNPIFDIDIAGKIAGLPQFEPCIAVHYQLQDHWILSFEYYAAIGPLTQVLAWQNEYQAPYITADVDVGAGFAIHFGVGTGLTEGTNPFVVKSILSKDL